MRSGTFGRMRWHQLRSVPGRPRDPMAPDRGRAQTFAALTAAHATLSGEADARLGLGWWRTPEAGTRIVLGAEPHLPLVAEDECGAGVAMLYPPGARAERLASEQVERELGTFAHWIACGAHADAVRSPDAADPARGGFEEYAAHLPHPFAWLVLATPVAPSDVEAEVAALEARFPALRLRTNSEKDRVELERAEDRYRDLMRARVAGWWEIRIAVGGRTAAEARATAAVLCSAGELADVPVTIVPDVEVTESDDCLTARRTLRGGGSVPFRAGSELLVAVAPTPTAEVPGLRVVEPHGFDLTVESAAEDGWTLGSVLDRTLAPVSPFRVARSSLNRHTFVCGATGSGKSQTVRSLLEELARGPRPVPWLAIEPAKSEYARMAGRLGDGVVTVIRPGDPDGVPACLNPLEPEPGFPLQAHADLVRALFLAAFEVTEPFPQVLGRTLNEVYTEAGWDLLTGEQRVPQPPALVRDTRGRVGRPRHPDLGDLQRTARRVVEEIGYGPEVAANVRGFVDVRIGSLRSGTPGRFFHGGHPLDVGELLARHVVLELDGVTNDQDKAFVIGIILIRLVEHLRVNPVPVAGLRHVLVVEEAHRLLKNVADGPAAAAVELFASLVAEIRAYGEGVVVVEQIPSKILPDVIKNSAVKILHRLPAADDRAAVGATINLADGDSQLVVALPPGRAAAAADGMDRPVLVAFPLREDRESEAGARRDPPLARPRSPHCPSACRERPCTARRINDAEHLARSPLLVLWVEMLAVALLAGLHPPAPSRRVRDALAAVPDEQLSCVVVQLAERPVAARRTLLRPWVDPEELTRRLLTEVGAQLARRPVDDGGWLRWTAGPRRFRLIEDELRGTPAKAVVTRDRWLDLGVDLDGPDAGAALEQLLAHPTFQPGGDRVVVGDLGTSLLRESVDALTGGTSARSYATAIRSALATDELVDALLATSAHLVATER